MQRLLKRFIRRGQVGQSIVILALGFVGLIAVVGVTTDISIMFARFAQLRRAVDAASIAAAGQMRQDRSIADVSLAARQFIEFHGLDPNNVWVETCANPPVADSDPAQGLQPPGGEDLTDLDPTVCTPDQRKLVRVTAQITSPTFFLRFVGWDDILLEASAVSETAVLDVVLIMDVSESMLSETTYLDWAEVDQGMAYLPPWLDTGDLTWSAANTPDTVLTRMADPDLRNDLGIGGASFKMPSGNVDDTYYAGNFVAPDARPIESTHPTRGATSDYDNDGVLPQTWWADWFWQEFHLGVAQVEINERLYFPGSDPAPTGDQFPWDDNNIFYEADRFRTREVRALGTQQYPPREECRVRFFPYSTTIQLNDYQQRIYTEAEADGGIAPGSFSTISSLYGGDPKWGGFVPTYDFYGCCNDPGNGTVDQFGNITIDSSNPLNVNADGDFSDLVCQPFKEARDATRLFLERIDFLRGDRVGFVTFDRSAFLLDFDEDLNGNGQIEEEENVSHMIESLADATRILNEYVGVRAEPNFYRWDLLGGGGWYWDPGNGVISTQFAAGINSDDTYPGVPIGASVPIDYNDPLLYPHNNDGNPGDDPADRYRIQLSNNYPVAQSCELYNSTMQYPFSRFATRNVGVLENAPSAVNYMTPPVFADAGAHAFTDRWAGVDWRAINNDPVAALAGTTGETYTGLVPQPELVGVENNGTAPWDAGISYEVQAGCRGTNIGASLREGSAAFVRDETITRSEGTVWVMILLSDGAAGASDPARRNGVQPEVPQPYVNSNNSTSWPVYDPVAAAAAPAGTVDVYPVGNYNLYGARDVDDEYYGFYGVCPPGGDPDGAGPNPPEMGELVLNGTNGSRDNEPRFPYCSDESPTTRHFCLPDTQARLNEDSSVGRPTFHPGFGPNAEAAEYNDALSVTENIRLGNVYDIDVGNYGEDAIDTRCDILYDVDDYARDWADFITGIQPVGELEQVAQSGFILPTIFTIGFGLNFENDSTGVPCMDNVEDCLGEELLRYIADVGDNFRVDTDYQQDWRYNVGGEAGGTLGTPRDQFDYGPKDPCEPQDDGWLYDPTDPYNIQLRAPGESCGNYYNAPSGAELDQVFDDIASRMFTRLTG